MPVIRLPAQMRSYTSGNLLIPVQGETVQQAVDDLLRQYPVLRPHLSNDKGEMRPFVNLFLNQEHIKNLSGMETTLQEQDQLRLLLSISGGS